MANLHRAFAPHIAGKVAFKPIDKTATADGPLLLELAGVGKNLEHCTLDAPIVLTLTATEDNIRHSAIVDRPIVLTLTGVGDVTIPATLDRPIVLTSTTAARKDLTATHDRPIVLTLAGTGLVTIYGQMSATLNTNHALTLAGQVDVPNKGLLAKGITLTLAGQGQLNNAVLDQSLTLTLTAATTTLPRLRGIAAMPAMTGSAEAYGPPRNEVTFPPFTGTATVLSERVYDGVGVIPALVGSATTGHSSTTSLPALTGSAQVDNGNTYTSVTTIPALTSDAVLIPDTSGYSATSLPSLTGTSTVVSTSLATSTSSLPVVTGDAVALAGLDSTSVTTLPLFTASAVMDAGQLLVSVVTLPALTTNAIADNGGALTATTHVFNTENMAATEYSNYDFIAMAMFNGVPVGISTSGVFELTGSDDDGTAIAANVLCGFNDMGTEDLKRMPNAYVGYKSDGDVQFQVSIDGEPAVRAYTVSKISNTSGIKRGRAKPAKGLKSRYWQVGVTNVAGSDLELDDLGLYVHQTNRKAQ